MNKDKEEAFAERDRLKAIVADIKEWFNYDNSEADEAEDEDRREGDRPDVREPQALVAEMLGALEAVLEEYAAWTVDRPIITAKTMLMVRDVIAKAKGE